VSRRGLDRRGGTFRGVPRGGVPRSGGVFRGVVGLGMTCRLGGGRASSGSLSHGLLSRTFLSFNILGRLLNILNFGRAANAVHSLGFGALSSLA